MSAVRQAARNYGLSDAEINLIPLNPATYGELKGYEAQFAAVADTGAHLDAEAASDLAALAL